MRVAVLGGGIVGSAAAWDLERRGHDVVVADSDPRAAESAAPSPKSLAVELDVTDPGALRDLLDGASAVVSAVPYAFGEQVARAAIDTRTHYFDFGGNPTVVKAQLLLNEEARAAEVAVVPDCGLAPGLANVLAAGVVDRLGEGPVAEVRLRVGALPADPMGVFGYQLAFNPAGLINEYAEPCEVLQDGAYATVDPLTGIEEVSWEGWGPLEAFHTAGGSSSLPRRWEGRVQELDYKTLRYPGHAVLFRAMLEAGLFEESPQPGTGIAPRTVLLEALEATLPRGDPDIVLLRVWGRAERDGATRTVGYQLEDRHDGRFSALARTTAFPATALADMVLAGELETAGAITMDGAADADALVAALDGTGLTTSDWP